MTPLRIFLLIFCLIVMLTQLQASQSKAETPKENDQPAVAALTLTKLGDKCYYFEEKVEKELNWTSAQQFCRSHGLQLASIETEEENNLIADYVRGKKMPEYNDNNWGIWNFWVSGSDSEEEDSWLWTSSGHQVNFTNWKQGHPTNWNANSDCLMLEVYADGRDWWVDYRCSEAFRFICESEDVCR